MFTPESLRPRTFWQTEADRAEQAGRFTEALAAAYRAHGLWKLWVPAEYGGAELDLPQSFAVIQDFARLDGALGWAIALGAGGGLFAAWLPGEAAREIFAPPEMLVAGSGAAAGTRTPVAGGFRIDGSWPHASFLDHATWVTGNTRTAGDADAICAFAVPATEVTTEAVWRAWAFRGTGSHRFRLAGAFVPEAHTFDLAAPPRLERPLYLFPFFSLATAMFAAVGLGLAQAALDEWVPSRSAPPAAVETRRAALQTHLHAGQAELADRLAEAWETVSQHGELPEAAQQALARACIETTSALWHAVDALADAGGMAILSEKNRWGRLWRNFRALRQHTLLSPLS